MAKPVKFGGSTDFNFGANATKRRKAGGRGKSSGKGSGKGGAGGGS